MKRICGIFLIVLALVSFGREYSCLFTEGGWDMKDWRLVRSSRWTYEGKWLQKDGFIQNVTPEGASPDEMLGKRAAETYTSMVLAEKLNGNAVIVTETSFDYKMAPLIVIAGPLKENGEGAYPEYQEHWEIVLYFGGLNVWHHEIKDGKPYWRKAAYVQANFQAGVKYELKAKIVFTAKVPMLEVSCGDCVMGCMLPSLPREFYAGITACEGINRFYSFKATSK